MLETCRNAQERWGGVHQLIDRWLIARRELVTAYETLDMEPLLGPVREVGELERLCDMLVDYMSTAHFEIYEQLVAEAREFQDERAIEFADSVYPRLQALTDAALNFNDRFERGAYRDPGLLTIELKLLGETLRERFELEDCLIEVLHTSHQQPRLASL
ncbi:sigma D regulator [Pseudomonas aestiva]|uniref:sigma D regulator n=1 Tax=Pseudomonas aestiva TaxID=3136739 RepID=UPI003266E4AF